MMMTPRLLRLAGSLNGWVRPSTLRVMSSSSSSSSSAPTEVTSFAGKTVPLGDNFSVRRILPVAKQRSVGPFVFLDHFGPVALSEHAMNVGPHPHIGLMTITYLYEGAILHRDSTGAEQIVVPGEVNGMSAGRGVTHSERGNIADIAPHLKERNLQVPEGSHGLQLWMALSKEGEDVEPSFHHGTAIALDDNASLIVGKSNGQSQDSVPMDPLLGKVAFIDAFLRNTNDEMELFEVGGNDNPSNGDQSIELGVYVSTGSVALHSGWNKADDVEIQEGNMTVVKISDASSFRGSLRATSPNTRVAILGGTPLPEKRHMFWNFVSASKTKVQQASEAWDRLDRSIFPKVINENNEDSIPIPTRSKKQSRHIKIRHD